MTTKPSNVITGFSLEDHAIESALSAFDPNSRSPAFAVQAIFKLLKGLGLLEYKVSLRSYMSGKIDKAIRGKVSWNKRQGCWQLGTGSHVPFEKIAHDTIRWYVNDWDFARHTRDTEVCYPEDLKFLLQEGETEHLFNSVMPRSEELTRRILTKPGSEIFYFLDVFRHENGLFIAESGSFADLSSIKKIGDPSDFWLLETKSILPFVKDLKVLSYRNHHILSRKGV